MSKDLIIRSSAEEFIKFKLQEKEKGIQVRYENETLQMTQKAMAELFDVEQSAIAKHLINIYSEKELDKDSTYSKMELVQKEGNRQVKRKIEFYNLDAIIYVGYRINSLRATLMHEILYEQVVQIQMKKQIFNNINEAQFW